MVLVYVNIFYIKGSITAEEIYTSTLLSSPLKAAKHKNQFAIKKNTGKAEVKEKQRDSKVLKHKDRAIWCKR